MFGVCLLHGGGHSKTEKVVKEKRGGVLGGERSGKVDWEIDRDAGFIWEEINLGGGGCGDG